MPLACSGHSAVRKKWRPSKRCSLAKRTGTVKQLKAGERFDAMQTTTSASASTTLNKRQWRFLSDYLDNPFRGIEIANGPHRAISMRPNRMISMRPDWIISIRPDKIISMTRRRVYYLVSHELLYLKVTTFYWKKVVIRNKEKLKNCSTTIQLWFSFNGHDRPSICKSNHHHRHWY